MNPIRVLIVDDSSLVRKILSEGLAKDPAFEIVGTAADPYEARDQIVVKKPHVLTLDVEMPRMNGIEFLKRLMVHYPIPVVMVSALTQEAAPVTFDALAAGAVDFVGKPGSSYGYGLERMLDDLKEKLKGAARAQVRKRPGASAAAARPAPARAPRPVAISSNQDWSRQIIAIGASTGGTEALSDVLRRLPANTPPVVMVQHMPPAFTGPFSERLNRNSAIQVQEASDGIQLRPGHGYLAPGGKQLEVVKRGAIYSLRVFDGPKVSGHAPSVDVMFESVAKSYGNRAVAAILTGMGADGASGMLTLRRTGARTVGQNEATCVVYGMPRAAFERGAVELVRPLQDVANTIMNLSTSVAQNGARGGHAAAI